MTGLLNPKSSEIVFFLHAFSRFIPRPWDVSSGGAFYFSPNVFSGKVLSSESEG